MTDLAIENVVPMEYKENKKESWIKAYAISHKREKVEIKNGK